MKTWLRLFVFYSKRSMRDSFTIGYSVIFPIIMVGLLGLLRKGSYAQGFSAFSYYAVAILPFIICCEITTAAYQGQEEARKKVAERFLISPVCVKTLLLAKWAAGTTILSICHGLVYVLFHFIFHVSYGGYGILVFLMSVSFTAVIYGMGLWFGLGMKNFIVVKNFVSIISMILAVLGGCFYPFASSNPLIQGLIRISPITWLNRASFLAIYDQQVVQLILLTIIFLVLSVLCIIIAVLKFRKEDFCNGDMFSYEK